MKNIIINLIGKGLSALLSFIFIPIYLSLIGKESFGLIGFLATIQAIFILLDGGFSSGYMRQISIYSVNMKLNLKGIIDLSRGVGLLFVIISFLAASSIFYSSGYIVYDWLSIPNQLKDDAIICIKIASAIIGLQFLIVFFQSGIIAFQKFILINIVNLSCTVSKLLLALLLMYIYERSVVFVFLSYLIITFIQAIVFYYFFRKITQIHTVKFSLSCSLQEILKIRMFIGGMALISLSSAVISQIDKLTVSGVLSITDYSNYIIAATMSTIILTVSSPIAAAIYPKLIQKLKDDDISRYYHESCQVLSIFVYPLGMTLVVFSFQFLQLWIGDTLISNELVYVARTLICGSTILAIMAMPHYLALANGNTRIAITVNFFNIIIIIPVMVYLAYAIGVVGVAISWFVVNIMFLFVYVIKLHNVYLKKDIREWYLSDNFKFLLISYVVAETLYFLMDKYKISPVFIMFVSLLISFIMCIRFSRLFVYIKGFRYASFCSNSNKR